MCYAPCAGMRGDPGRLSNREGRRTGACSACPGTLSWHVEIALAEKDCVSRWVIFVDIYNNSGIFCRRHTLSKPEKPGACWPDIRLILGWERERDFCLVRAGHQLRVDRPIFDPNQAGCR